MTPASGELGKRGSAIWTAYAADKLSAADQALVREFARCADTLDRLDGLAAAREESWATLVFSDMGEVHVSVDKILDERRNHQLALKALYNEIRQSGIKTAASDTKDEAEDPLAKRRREREERERKLG